MINIKHFNHVSHHLVFPELSCETTESGRYYTTEDGLKLPSITTILGHGSTFDLDAWKQRIGETEANKISFQAQSRGTELHTIAEKYLNNDPTWKNTLPIHKESFLSIKPILDSKLDNILIQEKALFSRKLKIAGRVDCIAEYNGILSVIDFKTSRKIKKKEWIESYFQQEAFYAAAFYEMFEIPIPQLVTIIIVDDESPQVFIENPMTWFKPLMKRREQYRLDKGI